MGSDLQNNFSTAEEVCSYFEPAILDQSMEIPSWDLSIPSPRHFGISTNPGSSIPVNPMTSMFGTNSNPGIPTTPLSGTTPMTGKKALIAAQDTPQSCTSDPLNVVAPKDSSGDCGRRDAMKKDNCSSDGTPFKLSRTLEAPRAFLQMRTCSQGELMELKASVIATIERNSDTYICIHDVLDMVAKKVNGGRKPIKWRHFDEHCFLFSLDTEACRDEFLLYHDSMFIGDGAITFKPWKMTDGSVRNHCLFKVWLRLTGLPIEYLNYDSAQLVVCSFGRLVRCNMEKKKSFVGAFYVMIECVDFDEIRPRVDVYLHNGTKIPVYIVRLYACCSDEFEKLNLSSSLKSYDEVVSELMDAGKMVML